MVCPLGLLGPFGVLLFLTRNLQNVELLLRLVTTPGFIPHHFPWLLVSQFIHLASRTACHHEIPHLTVYCEKYLPLSCCYHFSDCLLALEQCKVMTGLSLLIAKPLMVFQTHITTFALILLRPNLFCLYFYSSAELGGRACMVFIHSGCALAL